MKHSVPHDLGQERAKQAAEDQLLSSLRALLRILAGILVAICLVGSMCCRRRQYGGAERQCDDLHAHVSPSGFR